MRNEWIKKKPLLKRDIEFSVSAIEYCQLLENQKQYAIDRQLLRSATSIGSNAMEAQNAKVKPVLSIC